MSVTWVIGLAGAAAFAVALLLLAALAPAPALARRARRLRGGGAASAAVPTPWALAMAWLAQWIDRMGLLRGTDARAAAALLAQAGWRTPQALVLLLAARLSVPLVAGLGAWLIAHLHGQPPLVALIAGVAATLLASALPNGFVRNAATKRRQLVARALPDALDLFVICAEAGLSLEAGIRRIARELAPSAPALADVLALTGIELGFLPNRRDALQNLAARVPLPGVRGIVNILAQTERYGTPLAQALRVLAAEFRNTRMLVAEEKAARLPAILTIPMIVFILPPLFIVLIGPAILGMLGA